MFDIGFSEVLLIFALTLVVLGPDKLPQIARTMGRWAGRARTMARQFRDQLEAETDNFKVDLNTAPPAGTPTPTPTPAPMPAAEPAAEPAPTTTATPAPDSTPHDGRD